MNNDKGVLMPDGVHMPPEAFNKPKGQHMKMFNYAELENTLAVRIVEAPNLIKRLKELTKINAHGGALMEIAMYFGMKEHAAMFDSINRLHNIDGFLNPDMKDARFAIVHDMWTRLEKSYSLEFLSTIKAAL